MTFCTCGFTRDECLAHRCAKCHEELDVLLAEESLCLPCQAWLDLVLDGSGLGVAQVTISCRYPRGAFPVRGVA